MLYDPNLEIQLHNDLKGQFYHSPSFHQNIIAGIKVHSPPTSELYNRGHGLGAIPPLFSPLSTILPNTLSGIPLCGPPSPKSKNCPLFTLPCSQTATPWTDWHWGSLNPLRSPHRSFKAQGCSSREFQEWAEHRFQELLNTTPKPPHSRAEPAKLQATEQGLSCYWHSVVLCQNAGNFWENKTKSKS